MKKIVILSIAVMGLAAGLTSCKKDSNSGNSFKVRMTDGPGDFLQLNMQISSVDIYSQGNGWVNLSSQTQSVNVLDLTNGSEIQLANSTNVSAGVYTKLRITFASQANIVLLGGGSSFSLNWTGNTQQVEITINEQVSSATGGNLLIDFDVAQSVSELAGVYSIQPVISVIADESTGVKGHVTGASSAMVKVTGNGKTYSTYINAQGNFLLRGIASGTYTVNIWGNGQLQSHEVNNVVVTQGQITSMGNIDL